MRIHQPGRRAHPPALEKQRQAEGREHPERDREIDRPVLDVAIDERACEPGAGAAQKQQGRPTDHDRKRGIDNGQARCQLIAATINAERRVDQCYQPDAYDQQPLDHVDQRLELHVAERIATIVRLPQELGHLQRHERGGEEA